MSLNLKTNKAKVASGAALVALSGFVPQPMMQSAQAASATINVTASLITGISMVNGNSIKFGKVIATGTGGVLIVEPAAGALSGSVKVQPVSGNQVGDFKLAAAITGVAIDATVKGLGPVTSFKVTGGGAGPSGGTGLKIDRFFIDSANITKGAKITFSSAGGTSASISNAFAVTTTAQQTINVGAAILWGGTQPIGSFTQATTLILAF